MSVLRQRTSQRSKKMWMAAGVGALAMGVLSTGLFVWSYSSMKDTQEERDAQYQQTIQEAKQQLEAEQQSKEKVYVINRDISAGSAIGEADLQEVEVSKEAVPQNIIRDRNFPIGKFAKIDIKSNTPLTLGMLYDEGITPDDLRYQEFKVVNLPSDLRVDNFVDVRIKFPTGHDYIVLAKKKVRKLDNFTVWFEMSEKEILMMSSAIVDAYLENATLYSLTYVDPGVQGASVVNYPVNTRVKNLIVSNPNILSEAKRGLEERVRKSLEDSLAAMGGEKTQVQGGPIRPTSPSAFGGPTNLEQQQAQQAQQQQQQAGSGPGTPNAPGANGNHAPAGQLGFSTPPVPGTPQLPPTTNSSTPDASGARDGQQSVFQSNINNAVKP